MSVMVLLFLGLFFGFFDLFFLIFSIFPIMILMTSFFCSFFFGGIFFLDSLSFFLLYLTLSVFSLCVFSSLIEIWVGNSTFSFFFVFSCIFFLLFVSFSCLSVLLFYVCFELIFMFMFIFVLGWGGSPERLQASFYMVFYTIVVSFPFLVYIISFEDLFFSVKMVSFLSFSSYWWFFLFFVFLIKLPVYGVHLWLPKAHVEAPVSGSMVLAGVLLKLGGYGFFRFSSFSLGSLHSFGGYLYSIGLLGGLISCFLCLRQVDLKSFVAYSSVCHMGFGLGGIFCFSYYGYMGGVYMMIGHGFCSSCLFYILYVFYERFHTRSIMLLKGVSFMAPIVVLFWFVFSAFNMGVPPSFSFFAEINILVGVLGLSVSSILFVGLFLFFAGLYGIFLYTISCHGISFFDGQVFCISVREYLNTFGHFFPLVFIPLFCCSFFL